MLLIYGTDQPEGSMDFTATRLDWPTRTDPAGGRASFLPEGKAARSTKEITRKVARQGFVVCSELLYSCDVALIGENPDGVSDLSPLRQ